MNYAAKTINNIKSLNFFKSVNSNIIEGSTSDTKIININVEEKPTGEITAGAGFGTSGGTVSFGVTENNYLGKGLSVRSNISLNEESIRGLFSVTNPNYNNTDKSVYVSAQAIETYCFKLEKRISDSVALTVIKEFSLNLFAVSLTTAKASGKISFNFSSTLFSDDSFTLSISW